jgi:hypothetical protein
VRPLLAARGLVAVAIVLLVALVTSPAQGFCGFYVNTGGGPLFNEASRVVLMRVGLRTVLSIQNDYKGPPENFALVVPVPVVLERQNVRTLPAGLFDRVDRLSSPRLVEYWEQDPCDEDYGADNKEGGTGTRAKGEEGSMGSPGRPLVKIEAEFSVDEYDVVVLSALDSGALDAWLRDNHYLIPAGAEPLLRPYVADGSKFFVAKVDPRRVRFRWGRATLSPLRFYYDTPTFTLPIRLGLINSAGVQDLIVHVLGASRYETANYDNLTIPTNLPVKDEVRGEFNAFYAALFDQTVAGHPRAVVTEYAWSPGGCDPCPQGSGPLAAEDMALLGADVMTTMPATLVLTRLHARYGRDSAGEDLVLKTAPPIVGGRDEPGVDGRLPRGPHPAPADAFQGRYIIHNPWTGPVTCSSPRFGVWGPPPDGRRHTPPPTTGRSLVRRDLNVDALVLDAAGEEAAKQRRSPGGVFAGLWRWLDRLEDSREQRALLGLWVLPLAGLVVLLGARRRPGKVWRRLALFVVLALVSFGLSPICGRMYFPGRDLANALADLLSLLGLGVGAGGVALLFAPPPERAQRTGAKLLLVALLPAVAGFAEALRSVRAAEATFTSETFDLALAARIASEITAETLEPIVVGCMRAGLLLVVASALAGRALAAGDAHDERPAAPAVAPRVAGVLALAVVARILVRRHLAAIDGLILAAFATGSVVIVQTLARARRPGAPTVALGVVVGVLLLDAAARFRGIGIGMSAISGESVDSDHRAHILRWALDESNARLGLAVVDALLLGALAAHAAWRAGRDRSAGAVAWLGETMGIATGVALLGVLLAAHTPLAWTGRTARIAQLGAATSWSTGDDVPKALRAGAPAAGEGPVLVVDGSSALFGTAGAGAAPEPYGPALLDRMAQAAAESTAAPLLVAPDGMPLVGLLGALSPVLAGRQYDFRLVEGLAGQARGLGAFAPLLEASHPPPVEVDIVPDIVLADAKPAASARRCVGLLEEGRVLRILPLLCDGHSVAPGGFALAGEIALDGGTGGDATLRIEQADARSVAVLGFAPEETLQTAERAIEAVDRLRPQSGGAGQKFFARIVVSTGRAVLARAR